MNKYEPGRDSLLPNASVVEEQPKAEEEPLDDKKKKKRKKRKKKPKAQQAEAQTDMQQPAPIRLQVNQQDLYLSIHLIFSCVGSQTATRVKMKVSLTTK